MPAGRGSWRNFFGKRAQQKCGVKARRPEIPEELLGPEYVGKRNEEIMKRLGTITVHATRKITLESSALSSEHFKRGVDKLGIRDASKAKELLWRRVGEIQIKYLNQFRIELDKKSYGSSLEQVDAGTLGRLIGNFLGSLMLQGKFSLRK